MALGTVSAQERFDNPKALLGERLRGIYLFLATHGEAIFPHDYFADCYKDSVRGRPTVPGRVLATVMVLQAQEGLSDAEACDRLERDLAWQAAAGVHTAYEAFHPTVLVGMRNRLRASGRPRRLFTDTRDAAVEASLMGNRVRVVDSTPVYDSVATQDTVTQLRSAIRKLLRALDQDHRDLAAAVRSALKRDDDYASAGKPPCDWDDAEAKESLVDALVKDALAALAVLEGQVLSRPAAEAAELLALVAGQDTDAGDDGVFRIAQRVAPDRTISTVDPEARHGHKSHNRRFDGYKAHISIDPDSELIDEVVVTPANAHDATAIFDLLAPVADERAKPTVMGDSAYAGAATLDDLEQAGFADISARVPPARGRQGRFGKDDFDVDLDAATVTCPAGNVAPIRFGPDGSGRADFADACAACPLRERCTASASGRSVSIHAKEEVLQRHKAAQSDPAWAEEYRCTRPKVERKIAHLVRVGWGGRKARTRGKARVATDVDTRAAAVNWARLATLGLGMVDGRWAVVPP